MRSKPWRETFSLSRYHRCPYVANIATINNKQKNQQLSTPAFPCWLPANQQLASHAGPSMQNIPYAGMLDFSAVIYIKCLNIGFNSQLKCYFCEPKLVKE